jgi:cell division inhibitor SepF
VAFNFSSITPPQQSKQQHGRQYMSILASIKHIWDQGDDDYDDDVLDGEETPSHSTSSKHNSAGYAPEKYSSEKYASSSGDGGSSRSRSLRSVPIPLRAREKNIYTLRPKNQDEAAIAADYLKSGAAVVMNLETVERAVAIRIIDFMSGVCYGLEGQGHAMKLGDQIFLFTPAEFEISSDELDYGENRDFFFKDVDGSTKPQTPAKSGAASGTGSTPGIGSAPQSASLPSAPHASAAPHSSGPQLSSPQTGGNVTPSGYATADYAAPVSAKMSAPAPEAIASTSDEEAPRAASAFAPSNTVSSATPLNKPQSSSLPPGSVYGSSGKAHVLVGGKPASIGAASARSTQPARVSPSRPAPQSAYQPSEHRSWER